MKALIKLSIILNLTFFSASSFGQGFLRYSIHLDSLARNQPEFYGKSLGLDSITAAKVAGIMGLYKADLQIVMQDSSMKLDVRRTQIRILMKNRNQKLWALLMPE